MNNLGQVIIDESDMIDVLYRDQELSRLTVSEPRWIEQFAKNCDEYDLSTMITWDQESDLELEDFVAQNLSNWNLPAEYADLDITSYLLGKCKTDVERERVLQELAEFESRNMVIVLRWLKYFVDTMRENNMIWGVGRGSSVSSYVLYLLDIHRIDSIKYGLDITEFLK